MRDVTFKNAEVVLADEVVRACVHVRAGRIVSIDPGQTAVAGACDLDGDYLMPGLVELHSDNFERHLMPRPNVNWPALPALLAHDAEVTAAGVTTVYDALGIGGSDAGALRGQDMSDIVAAFDAARGAALLRADHRLHIRCELPAPNTQELFKPFAKHPLLGLLSLMDHTPGQRQWTDLEQARVFYTGKRGWSEATFRAAVAEGPARQEKYAAPNRRHFVAYGRAHGIPLASHDDTIPAHVSTAHDEGMVISEFPTSIAAAAVARAFGMTIVMGAPNIVRGCSHSGNIAAVELARERLLDTLSSDYVPASLLMGALQLREKAHYTLPEALRTVTLNPARAVGLHDRGEISIGKRGDLIRVGIMAGQPVIHSVWRAGVRVS